MTSGSLKISRSMVVKCWETLAGSSASPFATCLTQHALGQVIAPALGRALSAAMQHVTLPWHLTSFRRSHAQSIISIIIIIITFSGPKEMGSPDCLHNDSQGALQNAPDCHDSHWCHSRAGALRSCDPDRLVIKKVVLSGYPVKVHKKKAFVRWMFFGPEDVRWFRPVELWTKHGRRGRIKACAPILCLLSFAIHLKSQFQWLD